MNEQLNSSWLLSIVEDIYDAAFDPTLWNPTLTRLVDTDTLRAMSWADFAPNTTDAATLRAIEDDVAAFFALHTMGELYAIACETNLMLAPINSPAEILAEIADLQMPSRLEPPQIPPTVEIAGHAGVYRRESVEMSWPSKTTFPSVSG